MSTQYRSFLFRIWQAGSLDQPAWHASIEDVHTHQKIGFNDLQALQDYLQNFLHQITCSTPSLLDVESDPRYEKKLEE